MEFFHLLALLCVRNRAPADWCRAVAILTQGCRERPRLFAKRGELPLAGLRLFYSAGDPTERAALLRIAGTILGLAGRRVKCGGGARALDGTLARTVPAGMGLEALLAARAFLRYRLAVLAVLRFAPGGGFSIPEWMGRDSGDGLLFLTSPDDPNGRLQGLVSAWMEVALGAALRRAECG